MENIELARFWSRVEGKSENECWPWRGRVDAESGYGRTPDGKRAHRVAFVCLHGEIADGLLVRHLCHNKLCCNPAHLEAGTWLDNAADEIAAGKTHKGEKNGNAKLTAGAVEVILASPITGRQLAAMLGVSEATISNVRKRKTWRP